jgi:hypothetical protein
VNEIEPHDVLEWMDDAHQWEWLEREDTPDAGMVFCDSCGFSGYSPVGGMDTTSVEPETARGR